MTIRPAMFGRKRREPQGKPVVPPDPRAAISGPLDPELLQLRAALLPHRRRLWIRRLVRRGWIALAASLVAELALLTVARFVPLEGAAAVAAAIPIIGLLGWLIAGVRSRPRLGETALALDAEGRLGDRVSSAFELAVGFPDSAAPTDDNNEVETDPTLDESAETDRFVRRQRRDAPAAPHGPDPEPAGRRHRTAAAGS